jgi:hypothetical protein
MTCGNSDMPLALPLIQKNPIPAILDPDLSRLVTAWPDMPANVKRAILAMLETVMTMER